MSWIGAIATTGADHTLVSQRAWLERTFPDLHNGPSAWRVWPSATSETVRWAKALMYTHNGAVKLHKAVLSAIWANNRSHWNITCMRIAEAIAEPGDETLLGTVNSNIQSGRRGHARAALRLDTLIAGHGEALQRRADAWHDERVKQQRDEEEEVA
ncbi:hypothetical protein V7S43_001196 [Phytophthora oleae]|uniref:Uncharacterized protein n=1 Tax=Phytophthora oleae TaxID=2107226 RepID=A0ABD3G4H0_9STRA